MYENSGADILDALQTQRTSFQQDGLPSLSVRERRLMRLLKLVEDNEAAIVDAISADFQGRSAHETKLAELFVVRAGIRHALSHLGQWMRPRRVHTGLHFLPASNRLMPQPLGVVGIVSPWNYPLQLALCPALAALAAGNRVLMKPSELTPNFSHLLAKLVNDYFAPSELFVINGGADTASHFVAQKWDHLVFTGSTKVGRLVAKAAAANLTPVTLELGGKSPAIVDATCDLDVAAPRIAYGKFMNAGQTCIAPDYLLVPKGSAKRVADAIQSATSGMFPSLKYNADYTSIISDRHRDRLNGMIDDARSKGAAVIHVNPAGETFGSETRKIPPTLVLNPTMDMTLMQEEIFGPILPIVEYEELNDAISYINAQDHPLALYWFGKSSESRQRVLEGTTAGGVTINDCLWHLVQEDQPFGGVGASGMGAYHGQWGFDRFSHLKPIFHQPRFNGTFLLRPPYGPTFQHVLGLLKKLT
ncbi:aldehyde dehydrogenase [Aquabacterium sp. NJ1]|uniref:coniferyl aldehyde dehydrogenase n=1 Tax=Aquabacterium sp. NJ1 TaxID=1538295 RepID=UPI00052B591F|nr:coniferyl aldehyde dehydrogenase [Aquabacterium sp. NJ1]KGM41956.1 aldehyde dehydrogenase [Aquabacterium sp. NJ1]